MTWDQLMDNLATWAQDPVVVGVAAGVILLVVLLVVYLVRRRRRRRATFERRFGAEYQRTVESTSRRKAEHDLEQRTERHRDFEVRWLSASERDRFRARFESVQASFVDSPDSAVLAADGLIDEVAIARGYPDAGDRNRRLSDVSVDYPEEVAAHRRGLAELAGGEERATTEQLRKALLSARALFDRLVGIGDDAAVAEPPASLAGTATGAEDEDDEEIVVIDPEREPDREMQTVPDRPSQHGASSDDDRLRRRRSR